MGHSNPLQFLVVRNAFFKKKYERWALLKTAIGRIKKRSIKRNWKSPRFEADLYNMLTDVNWIAEYKLMYLKQLKLVTNAALPSLRNL